jgi:hypothetical protein
MSYTTRLPCPEFAGSAGGPWRRFPLVPDVPDCLPVVGVVVDAAPPDDLLDPAPVEADGPVEVEVVGTGVLSVEEDVDVCTAAADGC